MVDRMKDEMEVLKAQNEELKSSSEEKDAEIARLKKLLEEQNYFMPKYQQILQMNGEHFAASKYIVKDICLN